jgi:outer membrane protein assembly factor BamA
MESVLTVPRLIQPFNIDYRNSRYIPQTKFKAGLKFQRRVQYYQMNSIDISYGFEWRETSTKRHTLYPVNTRFIRLGQRTEEFDSLLQNDPYLQRSFQDQYILGSSYGYYFSTLGDKANRNKKHNYYFNGNVDLSGNVLHLTQNLIGSPPTDSLGNYTFLGETYSQFVRASVDFRHYWRMDRNNTLVSRFMVGAGYSFGNSVTLPYSMQFATGGANSLRAFRARSVGPGNFAPSDTVTFIDQTADIKLELNLEYRFTILGALKGGLYVDAGNIWTFREDPNRPGGKFKLGNVLDQLAVGTGLGIRYDFQFFILRMDWGIPIRLAYQYTDEEGNPAKFPVRPWEGAWLKRYLVWNLAIGYPF